LRNIPGVAVSVTPVPVGLVNTIVGVRVTAAAEAVVATLVV
jgi:hypothetical protein